MELRRSKDASSRPSKRVNDTVGWYLNHIKSHDVLTHQQVIELFKRYESGDKNAMNELVTQNLKLVVAVARAYRDKGVDWEDLLQEGNMGLIHAIEKFEWNRGHRFSTYATWWIRQRISHFLSTQRHSIRVPTHAMRLKKHIENTIEQLRKEGIQEPSWDKIAELVGSSADVVEATVAGSKATVSLSQPSSPDRDAHSIMDNDTIQNDPENPLATSQLKLALRNAVNKLDSIDCQIVELRVGSITKDSDKPAKLMLVNELVDNLQKSGTTITPNAVRARLKIAMLKLAEESCNALGIEMDSEQLEKISTSRAFQEAVASVLNGEDT
jgi:RNA polymerase primary sigma factor